MVQTADPYVRAPNPDGAGSALCPACGGSETLSIYTISSIPVQICVLLDTRQEALDYPCGDLDLRFCETCGFIFNAKFDASLLDYASAAEESQHFSATFSRYARDLANDIARKCQLAGKTVLEIGCGRGDFLAEVVALADCAGVGIDPGLRAGRLDRPEAKRLDFISDYFSAEYANVDCDVVVCRHTLEHIGPVADFLTDVRATIADRDGAAVFFEIPDVGRVLREGAFWDIYYEHCSYFTPGAQARLFRQEGFAVTELRLVYDDQYIILFAELGGRRTGRQMWRGGGTRYSAYVGRGVSGESPGGKGAVARLRDGAGGGGATHCHLGRRFEMRVLCNLTGHRRPISRPWSTSIRTSRASICRPSGPGSTVLRRWSRIRRTSLSS